MSPRLVKPGMRSVSLAGKTHPRTGEPIQPIGYINGRPLWPIMGASDDPNDPAFAGGGDDDGEDDEDEEDDESEEDEKRKPAKKATKKAGKHAKDEDDDEDDEEDDEKFLRSQEAMRYRRRLRAAEAEKADLAKRLKALEDKDKPAEEVVTRDLTKAQSTIDSQSETIRSLRLQTAFLTANTVEWHDPEDALAMVDLSGVDVDDDGTVDRRALRAALRDLARRKPHLVKTKPAAKSKKDDDDEEEDEDQGSRRTATMNGRRKGSRQAADRAALAKKFPALRA